MRRLGLVLVALAGCAGGGEADFDGDGVADSVDCAPQDPLVFPGGAESCANALDDDCDGAVDGDDRDCWVSFGEPDVDDDGDGLSESEGDCNDSSPGSYPGAEERCDGLDNDCNGLVDDDCNDVEAPRPFGTELERVTVLNSTGQTLSWGFAGALWEVETPAPPLMRLGDGELAVGETKTLAPVAIDIYVEDTPYTGVVVAWDAPGNTGCWTTPIGGRTSFVTPENPSVVWSGQTRTLANYADPCPYEER